MPLRRLFSGAIPRAAEHLRSGRLAEAQEICDGVLKRRPDDADALALHGMLLHRQGKSDLGLGEIRRAIQIKPVVADYQFFLATVLNALGQFAPALEAYEAAAKLGASYIIYNEWGLLLQRQGRLAEAIGCYRKGIELSRDEPEAHHNLATALATSGEWKEAEVLFRKAIALRPDFAEAHAHLGALCRAQDRREEAAASFRRAIEHNPGHALAHFNHGELLLADGKLAQGWEEYEWRLQLAEYTGVMNRPLDRAWDGSPLEGRTILVHAEQGLGDTIQFIRYLPTVAERGGRNCRIIVECQRPLLGLLRDSPLLARLGERVKLIGRGDAVPKFDVQAPMMSLPKIFGTTLADVPWDGPYLLAKPDRVARWQEILRPIGGLRIGIAWQGDPRNPLDRYRSIPLTRFGPIGKINGVRLISLQKGAAAKAIDGSAMEDLGPSLDADGAFLDTVAVMSCLDLVITCDSAIAHVAGATGIRVWVALSKMSDWRWMLNRDDTPWYPTMRLFRQNELQNWEELMERIAQDVGELAAMVGRKSSVRIEVDPGELIDRITILEIKSVRIGEPAATEVRARLAELTAARDRGIAQSPQLTVLVDSLRRLNTQLWECEDGVRKCEHEKDFGERFVELARSIYRVNDQRTAVKREINQLLGAAGEEKHYTKYARGDEGGAVGVPDRRD